MIIRWEYSNNNNNVEPTSDRLRGAGVAVVGVENNPMRRRDRLCQGTVSTREHVVTYLGISYNWRTIWIGMDVPDANGDDAQS